MLGGRYSMTEPEISEQRVGYFDTFDLRLYKGGYICLTRNGRFSLFSLRNGKESCGMPFNSEKPPRFQEEYPEGRLRDILAELIDVRALMPLAMVREQKERRKYKTARGNPSPI